MKKKTIKKRVITKFLIENKVEIIVVIISIVIGIILSSIGKWTNTDLLSFVSGILQVITVAVALASWVRIRQIEQKRKEAEIKSDNNDIVLIIDLSEKNNGVLTAVNGFIKANADDALLGALSKLNPTETVTGIKNDGIVLDSKYMRLRVIDAEKNPEYSKGMLLIEAVSNVNGTRSSMPFDDGITDYINDFKRCLAKVQQIMSSSAKTNKIHIFSASPIGLAAYVYSQFARRQVVWYAYNSKTEHPGKRYTCMGEINSNLS